MTRYGYINWRKVNHDKCLSEFDKTLKEQWDEFLN